MNEREQVISNLLYMKRDCQEGSDTDKTLDRAIALLKAQEPRAMKFDELEDTIADRAVWYEEFLTEVPTIAIVCGKSIADDAYTIFNFISGRHRVTRNTYGAAWRCWTSRPTDEQREKVKWE